MGKNKRQTFAYIKERVHKRLSGWNGKRLRGVRRELLVKVEAQFWWDSDPDSRKIHWKSRDKLCIAKLEGGMGFRNLYAFNLAVLAKHGWRIVQHPESLMASILKARVVLEKGLRWLIGDEASVRVWRDRWLPQPSTFHPLTMLPPSYEDIRVYELIDVERKTWCDAKLIEFF
ncbi:hypothetical protein ACFX15_031597 [Malus domestica]